MTIHSGQSAGGVREGPRGPGVVGDQLLGVVRSSTVFAPSVVAAEWACTQARIRAWFAGPVALLRAGGVTATTLRLKALDSQPGKVPWFVT